MLSTTNIIFAISGFLNAFVGLGVIIFVFLKGKSEKTYYFFYLSILAFVIWSFGFGAWQLSKTFESAIFWCRILTIGSTLLPFFVGFFTVSLLDVWKKQKWVLFLICIQTAIFLAFNFSLHFVNRVEVTFEFNFWPKPGIVYTLYVIFGYFGLTVYNAYLLYKNYRETSGVRKQQIKYAWFAYLIPIIGGATDITYWYNIPIPPWGNFIAFLYPFLMGYVLSRYRVLDIKVVLGRSSIYFLSILSSIFLVISSFIVNNVYNKIVPDYLIILFALFVGIYIYDLLFRFYEKIASRYFYYTFYSYEKVITGLGKKLVSILDLDKVALLITETLIKNIKLEKIAILLKNNDNYLIQKNIGFSEDSIFSIIKNNSLQEYITKTKKIFAVEEVLNSTSDVELIIPLTREEKIIGLIILGKKSSGDSYVAQDMYLLATLSNQISIAIENAILYSQVQDLSQNLQQKVIEQTKELRQAYQTEKKAREELEKLDKTKNQFLLAVQHHLRTPLTVMKWYSNVILGGTAGKQNKKTLEIVKKFQKSTDSLINMVNEFLDITQFQLGKEVINLQPNVSIVSIFNDILQDVSIQAKEKNIIINLNLDNKKSVYNVTADKEKLKVALFNIVDNAIKYTKNGKVDIFIKNSLQNVNAIEIIVKDTGIGMQKLEQEGLFKKIFERGAEAQKTFATGKGIGLYITGQIINSHKGTIEGFSNGPGMGSEFKITIPCS